MPKKRPLATETEELLFPVRLRAAMDFRGENQTSLAAKVNMKRQTIGYYMSGQSQPNTDGLAALSRALHVSADWLIGTTDKTKPTSEEDDIHSYFGMNAAHLIVEREWGETDRAGFIRCLLSDTENFDKLISAIKVRQKEKRERHIIFDFPDYSLKDTEESEMIETATKALVERYFWKIADKAFREE